MGSNRIKIMKKLETKIGYYRNGDIFSKIVCLPDNANIDDWKLVSDSEYQEWLDAQQVLDEQLNDAY